MLHLILVIFWAFACPNHSNNTTNHNPQVTAADENGGGDGGDTTGETEHAPNKPPKP